MKQWVSLLKDRVSFSPSSPTTSSPRQWSSPKSSTDGDTPKSRRKGYETEQELRTFWEEFRSSGSEKEKEEALEIVIEIFCKLCRKHGNPFEIINRLGDPRLFSFVLARSFVNDIERLKNSSPSCQLVLHDILHIFSGKGKEEEGRVSGLLYALENVIIPPLDVQPLLDAGLLSCMVAVLQTFVPSSGQGRNKEGLQQHNMEDDDIDNVHPISRLQGGLIHIMKTLARHKGAVQSLEDTDSLELLFHMVVINNDGQATLHMLQLQRHVMQIISSLLSTDDGGIGLYIHNRQLVKVLLKAVKDYEEENGDPAYVVGVVSLLLDCIQLSYRPGASGVKLREDFQNAHGYHLLAQLALKFSSSELWKSGGNDNQSARDKLALQTSDLASAIDTGIKKRLSPALLSLLDVLVEFTQVGTVDDYVTASAAKAGSCMPRFEQPKPSASERVAGDNKIRDVFAVQVLQDIFLKSGDLSLQIEVLDRLLRLLAGHPANYLVVQDLRILSLFVLNMASFPEVLQVQLLKVLEYVVTVVSLVPEQELLALCCLLQQPLPGSLSRSILLFFVKVLSFDVQYKKVLREVGLLDIIIEDVKKCTEAADVQSRLVIEMQGCTESMSTIEQANGKSSIFMRESTRNIAWDCLLSLIRQNEANQAAFRKSNSVVSILPLLSSSLHRPYVLRVLSTLITEDKTQSHPEDMNSLIKIINSGGIVTVSGKQWQVSIAAQTDILWMMWRILSSNSVLKNSFGEEGFMLLLSSFQNFHSEADKGSNDISLKVQIDLLTALFHLVTIAVSDHPLNRIKLREVINSGSFREYVLNCSLVASEYEGHFLDLLFDLALEHNRSPVKKNEACNILSIGANIEEVYVQDYTPDIEVDEIIEGKEIFNGTVIISLIMLLPRAASVSQIKILRKVELLVRRSMCNRECLSNIGIIHLLLETLPPTANYHATIWTSILQIFKLVGSYRLSSLELRKLLRYIWQWRDASAGDTGSRFVGMMEGILYADDGLSQLASSIKFHVDYHRRACVHISLGERYWPPAGGYSFACWFRYEGFLKKSLAEHHGPVGSKFQPDNIKLNIFSVECVDSKNITLLELSLNDMGILALSTSVNSQLVFKGVHLEEGLWYHLAIVHNKPNVLAGLFQSSLANLYVNGCLRFTGKLGYTASSTGRALQSLLGSSSSLSAGSSTWQISGCYLFEEVLAAPAIYLMYILGRGYHGLFQDIDLLRFVPYEACGGENLAILETIETASSSVQKGDKLSTYKITGAVWELERLALFWSQLSTKKMIFAFDGTPSDPNSIVSITNLVDPLSAAASPLGGLPRIGRLSGDVSILRPRSLGDSIRTIGGVAVVLALVEAAQTPEMLHLALLLLVRVMHCNPRNAYDLLACRGYHLLALFLHQRMEILGLQDLELLFQIAACEASVAASRGILEHTGSGHSAGSVFEASLESISLATVSEDQASSLGSPSDMVDSFGQDAATCMSDLGVAESPHESLNCIVLSNPDMMEYVLLDWTIWGTASLPIQLALLNFIERLVAMHRYRNHNLTTLRSLNIIQHLLVTLQRMDIEIPVAEKLVVLLGILLEDGFLTFELKHVADFVVMTFEPPGVVDGKFIPRESMGMQVIVRNILLEMLIDLQTTICTEEILDTWHKLVSSRLVTFLLDEAVHPTTLRWVMTLLGVCMSSSQAFAVKFRASGGYQALKQVLPSFYDSPDVYYVLFCLLFGRAVYPRKPEVRMLDFFAFMPNDGGTEEIQFVDLLDSILAMSKAAFDRMSQKSKLAQEMGEFSYMEELLDSTETSGELQGEALLHKTYAARLMGGEAAAPSMVTSILRFMVDLAKMCRPFSTAFRRHELLEDCVDLYFSCARSAFAVRATKFNQPVILTDQSIEMSIQKDDENTSRNIAAASNLSTFGKGKSMTDSTGYAEKSPGNTLSNGSISKVQNPNIFQYSRISALSDSEYCGKGEESLFSSSSFSESSSSRFVTLPLSPASSDKAGANEVNLEHRSSMPSMKSVVPGSPTFGGIASWLGNSWTEGRSQSASASLVNVPSTPHSDAGHDASAVAEVEPSLLTVDMLVELDAAGSGGGPFSGGAAAVLDLIAEVLADALTDQPKAALAVESALEAVPLSVRPEVALNFQGLCLNRMMNFLERRLLRDEEGGGKKLDKSRWSANLETFSALVVDRLYMGAFTDRAGPLKVLEFLLAMLQLANKDGRVEEASPARGLLSLARGGSRPADPFIISLLKNTNRTVMYCFLFPACGDPDDEAEQNRNKSEKAGLKPTGVDIVTVLQLLMANKSLIFCANNVDREFVQSLLYNVVPMLQMERQAARVLALDVCKAILIYRREVLEDVLVLKGNQGELVDMLHGGFDKLLLNNGIEFFTWFDDFQSTLQRILNRRCSATWMEFIAGTARFPDMRIKSMETRRKRELMRRCREVARIMARHWDQMVERRVALDLVRETLQAEIRAMRQLKYGWVIHADSEWQGHLQQLMHERGLWPARKYTENVGWYLCSTEGPYRMRKRLLRSKPKDTVSGKVADDDVSNKEVEPNNRPGVSTDIENPDYDSFFHLFSLFSESPKEFCDPSKDLFDAFDDDSESRGLDEYHSSSSKTGVYDDQSSNNETEMQLSGPSRKLGVTVPESSPSEIVTSVPGSVIPEMLRPNMAIENGKVDNDLHDNGEYLITPYLERGEKLKFKNNCERVVGLDKHDGVFLIGEICLYVIENFYIDKTGHICEKTEENEISVLDQVLGVSTNTASAEEVKQIDTTAMATWPGGKAWAYHGGSWRKDSVSATCHMPHSWRKWKLDSVQELLKRQYQLRPVAIELFSMDGCNDLLIFHKEERDEVFKNLTSTNLPRNRTLDTTISGLTKQEAGEGGRLFKLMAKSFSKRWQNGEISNFQYLMHLNTLAGRGYNDLTQYPVFPWVLADYESKNLDLNNPASFRQLDKPMGALSPEREEIFRKRYENWDDPEIPKFHYGSHYSSAGIVLFYLIRLPPFSYENMKLQGGQFDHADRLFNSIRDTWSSASHGNTADVKELIPEFFYLPEFLENRQNFDFGVKQSGDKVDDIILPPWANGSAREFIRKHREALESPYVSENLHHWIDLIFGFRQRGQAAVDATNVFYYLTYEGAVDIDSVPDPSMKASTLAQINHFGQTPRQLFLKPHPKRKSYQKVPSALIFQNSHLITQQELRKISKSISQIVIHHDRIHVAESNCILKPRSYTKYVVWGFPDNSLRFLSYDQDKLLSTHEGLHDSPIQCAALSQDGRILATGDADGAIAIWRLRKDGLRGQRRLHLQRALCAHSLSITCIAICQPYGLIVSGSKDCTIIFWDLTSMEYVRQLPVLPAPPSAIHINDMTGDVVTAAGTLLAIWSLNGDCLAAVNVSNLVSETILSVTSPHMSDWSETGWYVTGHQSGVIRLWRIDYDNTEIVRLPRRRNASHEAEKNPGAARVLIPPSVHNLEKRGLFTFTGGPPEYILVLHKVLKWHKNPVTAVQLSGDLKQLVSGDTSGHLISWFLADESSKAYAVNASQVDVCPWCQSPFKACKPKYYCKNCGRFACEKCCSDFVSLPDLGYSFPVRVCRDCFQFQKSLRSSFSKKELAHDHGNTNHIV